MTRRSTTKRSPKSISVPRRRRRDRGGYLYVSVLFTSLIVAGAIATAVSLDTARIKTQNSAADRSSAIRLAESELHRVSVWLSTNPTWRDDMTHGDASSWIQYGSLVGAANATARFSLRDSDGNLGDDVFDDTQVIAEARFGSAQAAVSVVMENGFDPLDLLRYGVTTFDDLQCDNDAALVCEKPVQVFDDCKTSSAGYVTTARLECSGSIDLSVRGDIAPGAVEQPGFDVVQRYRDVGTEISVWALPYYNGARVIYSALISKSENPYGASDAHGVYWIDAQGQQITIADSRIAATIAIHNANWVVLAGSLVWEAPPEDAVLLVTDTHVNFVSLGKVLDEATLAANFNPPSTPYRGIDSNLSTSDRFPTEFRGIVYTSGNLYVSSSVDGDPLAITGAVICRDLFLYRSLFVRSFDEVLTDVPRGFADPHPQRFKTGTFRRAETL